jgi:hydroxypyruvate reductase 1
MNVIYYDLFQSTRLENFVTAYGEFLKTQGETPVYWRRATSPEEVLKEADVVWVLSFLFQYFCLN